MAVARLYQAKQRPQVNPLISHFADIESALAAGRITKIASRLAEEFWPGPITLIIDRHANSPTCLLATAGMDNLAIRVPNHEVARALITSTGGPVVAPSAMTMVACVLFMNLIDIVTVYIKTFPSGLLGTT